MGIYRDDRRGLSVAIQKKYVGEFKNRAGIAQEFQEGTGSRYGEDFKIAPDFPTRKEILYASYECPPYEGYAFVLYERDGKLYEVNGSHCSCFGLEGQWKPEETSWGALAMRTGSHYGTPDEVVAEAKRRTELPQSVDAVDPQAGNTGKPTTRV